MTEQSRGTQQYAPGQEPPNPTTHLDEAAPAPSTPLSAWWWQGLKWLTVGGAVFILGALLVNRIVSSFEEAPVQVAQASATTPTTQSAPVQTTRTCPAFAAGRQNCEFGDQIVWVSTGSPMVNPDGTTSPWALCYDRLASPGDYTQHYGGIPDQRWAPGVTGPTGSVGFQAPKGEARNVTYWLAPTQDECART